MGRERERKTSDKAKLEKRKKKARRVPKEGHALISAFGMVLFGIRGRSGFGSSNMICRRGCFVWGDRVSNGLLTWSLCQTWLQMVDMPY